MISILNRDYTRNKTLDIYHIKFKIHFIITQIIPL